MVSLSKTNQGIKAPNSEWSLANISAMAAFWGNPFQAEKCFISHNPGVSKWPHLYFAHHNVLTLTKTVSKKVWKLVQSPSFPPCHCFKVTVTPVLSSFNLSSVSISLSAQTGRSPPQCFKPPPHKFPGSVWGGGFSSSPQHHSASLSPNSSISLPPLLLFTTLLFQTLKALEWCKDLTAV